MKKRIISFVLVIAVLTLTLVSCGYSYAKDDLSQYATFDKAAFEQALAKIVIEDGDYSPEDRDVKLLDHINELLAKKIDTTNDEKIKEGVVVPSKDDKNNDKLYYCYYATFEKDGETVVVYAASMKYSSPKNIQFGLSDLDDFGAKLEEAFVGVDIKDYVYETVTSGSDKSTDGKEAYVTYTVELKPADGTSSKKTTYTNVKVILGDHAEENGIHNYIAKSLVGKTIGSAVTDSLKEGEEGADQKTYSGVKIDWVVDKGAPITFKNVTYDVSTKVKGVDAKEYDLKDVELTYYVYPAYFYEVEDISAEAVIETLNNAQTIIDNIKAAAEDTETKEEDKVYYRSLKECIDLLEVYIKKAENLEKAEKALEEKKKSEETAKTAYETAKTNLEKAQKAVDDAKEGDDLTALNKALEDAKTKEKNAKTAYDTTVTNTAAEQTKVDTAKDEKDTSLVELFKKAGSGDVEKGKAAVLTEYREITHDNLVDQYNNEIKMNIAKKIWEAIDSSVTQKKHEDSRYVVPKKAVQEVYDRMYESYQNTFYTGTESTTSQSNYKYYNGDFQEFLIAKTVGKGKGDFQAAKDYIWVKAEEYVVPIIKMYIVAETYDQILSDKEIKEYKKDPNGAYSSNEYYQGETNTIAAYQLDNLLNYFLESEEDDEGNVTYKNALVKYTINKED